MRLIFCLAISCFATTTLIGQICTDGSIPTTRTVSLTGVNSWDLENDPSNEGGVLNFGSIGDIVGIDAQNVDFTTVGASWCSELLVKFNTNFGDVTGIYYTPSFITGTVCTDLPTSTGLVDLDALGLVIPTDALGNIYWEVFESFDDVPDAIDATMNSGTVTLYHCPTGIILPLEIMIFGADPLETRNRIYWSTTNETNVQWLVIERSIDGISEWNELFRIQGRNNGDTTNSYEFLDEEPPVNGYYRLSEVSLDGVQRVYETVHVLREPDDFELFSIYPNPSLNGEIFADYYVPNASLVDIKFFNLGGQLQRESIIEASKGFDSHKINLEELESGFYIVEITYNSKSERRKLLKLN